MDGKCERMDQSTHESSMTERVNWRGRSIGISFVAALIIFSAILCFSYYQSIDSIERVLNDQIEVLARDVGVTISKNFPTLDRETKLLSRNKALKNLYAEKESDPAAESDVGAFLSWFRQNAKNTYLTIGYLSPSGSLLYDTSQETATYGVGSGGGSAPEHLHMARLFAASEPTLSVRIDTTASGVSLVFLSRALKMRRLSGTVVAVIPTEELFRVPLREHMVLSVHDRHTGQLVYRTGDDALTRLMEFGEPSETIDGNEDGHRILGTTYELENPAWSVNVHLNADPYLKKPRRAGRLTLLVSLGFVLISGSIIRSLLKRIERRSADLAQANAEIEERNHSLEEAQKIVRAHNEMLEAELATASSMQMKLMPDESPTLPGFSISGHCRPATQVGGDFFQYYPRPDGRLSVAMADVTGHGMEAAIPTVLFSGMLDNQMENTFPPEDLFGRLNRSLVRNLDRRTFVCFSLGELDPLTRRMRLVNGGCPYPYHYQAATGKTRELTLGALPLGLRAECEYDGLDCQLDVGDRVVFCSDGIIEAMDDDGQLFGFERTQDTVNRLSLEGLPATQMIEELLREVDAFRGDAEQQDDQTILVVEVT